jgi:lysophospholipid acyltransferase (LPLAT)-like uncharacterized protein
MSQSIFGQFEVRRQQSLQQQMTAVSALLLAVHLLWWIQSGKNMCRLKTWDTAMIFIPFREQLCQQRIQFHNMQYVTARVNQHFPM